MWSRMTLASSRTSFGGSTAYGLAVTVVPASLSCRQNSAGKSRRNFPFERPRRPCGREVCHRNIRRLIGKKPIFGICLGHQILGTLGGKTFKLKFGHRGGNQPVKNLLTGKIEITSQNHGFAVDPDSLEVRMEVTHINLNDGTNEGLRHREVPLFSVQYHPEASPGPHDSDYLFRDFVEMMKTGVPVSTPAPQAP